MVALWVPIAQAWEHAGWAWTRDEVPIQVEVSAASEPWLTEVPAAAYALWREAAPCSYVTMEFGSEPSPYRIVFDDPEGKLPESMIYVTYTRTSIETNDVVGWELIFNDGVFSSDGDGCTAEELALGVMARELGHLLGLGDPCDDGAECSALEQQSIMSWDYFGAACRPAPNQDDVDGLYALYTVGLDVDCDSPVPFEVDCVATALDPDPVVAVRWDWGDGATSEGWTASHVYATHGFKQLTVGADDGAECVGTWMGVVDASSPETPATEEVSHCECRSSGGPWWLAALVPYLRRRHA